MSALRLIDNTIDSSIKWEKSIKRIGMDGKGVGSRKQVFNITNLVDNQVIGVLPNLSQKELKTKGIHNHFERIKKNHFGIRNIERFCKRLLFCTMPMAIFLNFLAQKC